MCGVAVDGAYPMVSSRGKRVLAKAMLFRTFRDMQAEGKANPPHMASWKKADQLMWAIVPYMVVPPLGFDEWLRGMPRTKKRLYAGARERYLARGIRKSDLSYEPFVKSEKLPAFTDGLTPIEEYVPRLIMAPKPISHVVTGPTLKAATSALKSVWNEYNHIFYAAVNTETLDRWFNTNLNAGYTSFFWSDYSAFDCTHSNFSFGFVEKVYRSWFPGADVDFWTVIDGWRTPRGSKGGIRFNAGRPMLASGRDDTALVNAMVNGVAMSLSLTAALLGIRIDEITEYDYRKASTYYRLAIVGDDCLVMLRGVDQFLAALIVGHIRTFGLSAKAGWSRDIERVTFLGMCPYNLPSKTGRIWAFGPTIGRRMYKAFWQTEPVGNPGAWANGVAKQLSVVANHVPVLSNIASRVLKVNNTRKVTELSFDPDKEWTRRGKALPDFDQLTVEHLALRYREDCTPGDVWDCISKIEEIETLPCTVRHRFLQVVVCTDEK